MNLRSIGRIKWLRVLWPSRKWPKFITVDVSCNRAPYINSNTYQRIASGIHNIFFVVRLLAWSREFLILYFVRFLIRKRKLRHSEHWKLILNPHHQNKLTFFLQLIACVYALVVFIHFAFPHRYRISIKCSSKRGWKEKNNNLRLFFDSYGLKKDSADV